MINIGFVLPGKITLALTACLVQGGGAAQLATGQAASQAALHEAPREVPRKVPQEATQLEVAQHATLSSQSEESFPEESFSGPGGKPGDQVPASRISLQECYQAARANYPLVRQRELIERARDYSLENAARGNLPGVLLVGQASYQSEVTKVPFSPPGAEIEPLSKDQYKLYAEVNQTLYDNGLTRKRQNLVSAEAEEEQQRTEVGLHQLKERVNHLFFGILLLDGQLRQNSLLRSDIEAGLEQTGAAVAEGAALESSADVLRAALLEAGQRKTGLSVSRQAYLEMLALLTGLPLEENTVLVQPAARIPAGEVARPELDLYKLRQHTFSIREEILKAGAFPKLGLFFQGGLGRPALNMLSNEPEGYYLGGIRLTWSPSSLYTLKNERRLLHNSREAVAVQEELFLFNTRLTLREQQAGILKYQQLIRTDREIIELRSSIKKAARAQLAGGVITSRDYLREANAESQARENLLMHEIQLLMEQYNYQATLGN